MFKNHFIIVLIFSFIYHFKKTNDLLVVDKLNYQLWIDNSCHKDILDKIVSYLETPENQFAVYD